MTPGKVEKGQVPLWTVFFPPTNQNVRTVVDDG